MDMTFWLPLVLLVILALVFVIYPMIFFQPRKDRVDRRQQNLATYRSRMEELDAELDSGNLDKDSYEKLKVELEASLLEDVGDPEAVVGEPVQGSRRAILAVTLVVLVVVPAGAFYFYDRFGFQEELFHAREIAQMQQRVQSDPEEMLRLLDDLRDRLEAEPNHVQGWTVLARSNMQLERYDEAADAFSELAKAMERTGEGDPGSAWGLSAQALFIGNQGRMMPQVREAIERARAHNPDEVNSLSLLGITAFQTGSYRDAIGYWERILEVAPDHPQAGSVRQGIVSAYNELGEPVPQDFLTAPGAPASGDSDARVTAQVQLSEQAASDVGSDDVVFIYARSVEGPPRPLSIARVQVSDLPLEVTLDDTMGMTEDGGIHPGQEVILVARVSRDGNATPQPGDWEGEVGPVRVGAGTSPDPIMISRPVQ